MSVPSAALSFNPSEEISRTSPTRPESVIRFPRPWLFGALAGYPPRALAVASAIIQWTTPEHRGRMVLLLDQGARRVLRVVHRHGQARSG